MSVFALPFGEDHVPDDASDDEQPCRHKQEIAVRPASQKGGQQEQNAEANGIDAKVVDVSFHVSFDQCVHKTTKNICPNQKKTVILHRIFKCTHFLTFKHLIKVV